MCRIKLISLFTKLSTNMLCLQLENSALKQNLAERQTFGNGGVYSEIYCGVQIGLLNQPVQFVN